MVSWKGRSEKYRVMVSRKEIPDADRADYTEYDQDFEVAKSDSVMITNLTPSTTYYVYLQSICGLDTSKVAMESMTFTTLVRKMDLLLPISITSIVIPRQVLRIVRIAGMVWNGID